MSFSGTTTITQSGTDTSLAGLTGLSNVTTNTNGLVTEYILTDARLVINGTLSFSAVTERLVFRNSFTTGNILEINSGDSLTITCVANGVTRNDYVSIDFGEVIFSGFTVALINMAGTAQLSVDGSTIAFNGDASNGEFIDANSSSNVSLQNMKVINYEENPGNHQINIFSSATASYSNCIFKGIVPTYIRSSSFVQFDSITIEDSVEGIAFNAGSTQAILTVPNLVVNRCGTASRLRCTTGDLMGRYIDPAFDITELITARLDNTSGRVYALIEADLTFNIEDDQEVGLTQAKVYGKDVDNGSRIPSFTVDGQNFDYSGDQIYTGTGASQNYQVLQQLRRQSVTLGNTTTWDLTDNRGTANGANFEWFFIEYDKVDVIKTFETQGLNPKTFEITFLPDPNITNSDRVAVLAYTELETPQKFYDRYRRYKWDNPEFTKSFNISRNGDTIDAGAFNVIVDATAGSAFTFNGTDTITIHADVFVGNITTTGNVTLSNGAVVIGTVTDSGGTTTTLQYSVTGLVANSRVQIYNVTTASEFINQVEAGTSITGTYDEGVDFTSGDSVRVRVTNVQGVIGYAEYEALAVATGSGWAFVVNQVPCTIYNGWGLDGSTVTKFSADYVDDEVDLTIASDFEARELGAWWKYNLYTENGLREFFGGINFDDEANIRILNSSVSIFLDNTTATNVNQTDNRRIFRDDGQRPVKEPSTGGGGIDVEWRSPVTIAEVEGISANVTAIKTQTDQLTFTGGDVHSTLDGEEVTTDSASRAASQADVSNLDVPVSTRATPADVQIAGQPVTYTATTFTRTDADNDGGGLTEIQSLDGQYAISGETATGLEVQATVGTSTNSENPTLCRITGYYSSAGQDHEVAIQAWNFTTSAWDDKGVMTDRSTPYDYVIPLGADNQDGTTGEMRIRFLHNVVTYKTQHALYIDYIGWEKVQTNSSMASDIATILNNQQQLLEENKITSDYVVSSTANTVTLATSASFEDGTYDPATIKITSGTGAGQSRTILQYSGSTKVAVINRDWKVQPDTSSWYVIEEYAGDQSVNEGLLQGGSANTATLNADASSVDDVYNGQLVFIVSGTGQDQTGLIIDYNGTTKVATIAGTWSTTPDATSGYMILPSSPVLLGETTHTGARIPNVTLVDTTTTNTDMRGTDGVDVSGLATFAQVAGLNDISVADVVTALTTYGTATEVNVTAVGNAVAALNDLSVADVDASLASYDAPTKAELDATQLAITNAIDALNNLSEAQVNAQADLALTDYDGPTKAELDVAQASIEALITTLDGVADATLVQATLARKHLTNRDKIDDTAKTLTRYDDDKVTPLVVFDLKGKDGAPDSDDPFEKIPQ